MFYHSNEESYGQYSQPMFIFVLFSTWSFKRDRVNDIPQREWIKMRLVNYTCIVFRRKTWKTLMS